MEATMSRFSSLYDGITQYLTRSIAWWEIEKQRPKLKRDHTPCPLCGGPMLELHTPIAVKRMGEDEVTQVPARLSWKRCGGCRNYQQGEVR